VTSSASFEGDPDSAGGTDPDSTGGPDPASAGGPDGGGRLPKPSRRQIWLTLGLVALVIGGGVFALVSKSGGGSPSATPSTTTPGLVNPAAASSGPTSTVPGSSGQAANAAAHLEIGLRSAIAGCWDDAEPGARDGAYRQDYHYPRGRPCTGSRWDVDVQFFANPRAAAGAAASSVAAPRTAYVDGDNLVVLAGDASTAARRAVASQPGAKPVPGARSTPPAG
jgi:hypothetical protein